MAQPKLTRSAALHEKMRAFAVLFATFCVVFEPTTAFVFSLATTAWLAKV
jgi:hypothetical protein